MSDNEVTIKFNKKTLRTVGSIILILFIAGGAFAAGRLMANDLNNAMDDTVLGIRNPDESDIGIVAFDKPILGISNPDETGIPVLIVEDPKEIDVALIGFIISDKFDDPILAFANPTFPGNADWFDDPILAFDDPILAMSTPLVGLINMEKVGTPLLAIVTPSQITTPLIGLVNSEKFDDPILAVVSPDYFVDPILTITNPGLFDENLLSVTFGPKWDSDAPDAPRLIFDIPAYFDDPILAYEDPFFLDDPILGYEDPFFFDIPAFYEDPFFFENPFFLDPVSATLLTTSRPSENVVMYTFEVPDTLPGAKYTANFTLPDGGTENFDCETLPEYPDRIYCYGGLISTGVDLSVTIYASDANYSLGNVISPGLLDARAEGLGIDWGPYNAAADNMGLGYKVDNPFEAWNVIGCCVMNSEGELPAGCESLPVGNNNVPDFFGVDQVGNEGAADAIWNNIMEDALAPNDWEPEYNGEKIDEEALLAKANACASSFGGGNISSIGEAREFYNVVKRFDTRVDDDRSWGAEFADSFTGFFDTYFGWLVDPDYWSSIGTDILNFNAAQYLKEFLTDAGKALACSGMYTAQTFSDFDIPDWCFLEDGTPKEPAAGIDYNNYQPEDLIEPLPDSCLDYIDYANQNTYFLLAKTTTAGFYTEQYCLDALDIDPGISSNPFTPANPDALYDALIENYEYVDNPAMPDACKAYTDWCNSDQLGSMGNGFTNPIVEGSMMAVNGCNDPDNYMETQSWSANQEPPDCSFLDTDESGFLGVYDMLRNAYEADSPYVTNTHCYQVWSERENFNNTPAGQVKNCADAIKFNKPLETVADYMDFLTFMGVLAGLYQDDYAANYPGCQEALDWAYWMGLDRQGINAAGTSCDGGGPSQVTQPLIFINPQTFYSQPSAGGGGGNGGGNSSGVKPVPTLIWLPPPPVCVAKACSPGYYFDLPSCSCQQVN